MTEVRFFPNFEMDLCLGLRVESWKANKALAVHLNGHFYQSILDQARKRNEIHLQG